MKYIQCKHTEKGMFLCMHTCYIFIITQQVCIKFGTEGMSNNATQYNSFYLQAIHCNPNITWKQKLCFINIWQEACSFLKPIFWCDIMHFVLTAYNSTCCVVRYKRMTTNLIGAQGEGVAHQDTSIHINREDESGSRNTNNHRVSALWVYMQVILIIQQQDTTQGFLVAFMQQEWLFNLITKSYQSIRLSKRLTCNGVEHKQHTFTCHLMNNQKIR